jgi:hypothetical protein
VTSQRSVIVWNDLSSTTAQDIAKEFLQVADEAEGRP